MAHPDRGFRAAMRWYYAIGRRVWPYELWHWLFHDHRTSCGPSLAEFWNGTWKANPRTPLSQILKLESWPLSSRLLSFPRMGKRALAIVSTKADQLRGP
jgi:hypothetical protein